jgi:hypothetical protein
MSAKDRQPPTRPWCWNTLERLESDAWRSRGINTVRFIEFLEREDMRHGGAQNGNLKAPYEQLQRWGISARHVNGAIEEAINLGLVDAKQPGERKMSTYALTWLPLHDGMPASNRWKAYRNPDLQPPPVPKPKNLPTQGKAALPTQGKADGRNLPTQGKADRPQKLPTQGKVLLKCSYRRGDSTVVSCGSDGPEMPRCPGEPAARRYGLNGPEPLPSDKATRVLRGAA